jgi:Rod binding domain-containing protein
VTFVSDPTLAKKGKGLSSLMIQQIGRGKQKRRRGNDGQAIPEKIHVTRATEEDKKLHDFLNGGSLL